MMTQSMFIRLTAGFMLLAIPLVSVATPSRTQEWIQVLESDASVFEKARACQQLGEFGTREAVPALASLLDHDILSAYARAGLERIPGPEASAALRNALDRLQGKRLVGVINSLAALRDEKTVPALHSLTRNADPEVVKAALLALGRIANDEAVTVVRQALVDGPEENRAQAAAACLLAAQGQLNQGNAESAKALYDIILQAEVPVSYRIGATRGAILARTSDRIAFLMQQLRSNDRALRNVALLTIREIPSDSLATALNAELGTAPRNMKIQLIMALQDCHNIQSLQVLKTKMESNDPEIRVAALRVIKEIGGPDDAPTLIKVLSNHRSVEEVSLAVSSLEQMEGAHVDDLLLQALSSSTESESCIELIQLLGKRAVTGAIDALLQQAAGLDARVNIAAYHALKSMAGLNELPKLIALTKACSVDSTRNAAVSAVYNACKNTEHQDRAGALVLKELQTATSATEKQCWIRILAMLGYNEALPDICATLGDANQDLVQSTISQLGRWPDPAPIAALFKVVEGNASSNLRRRALTAALQLTTSAADQKQATNQELVAWFRRAGQAAQSVSEKRLLISGLGRVQHIQSVQLLSSYLADANVKIEAAYAIVNAAQPLAKGPQSRAVASVLERISGIEDKRLLEQIEKLKRDIKTTTDRVKH